MVISLLGGPIQRVAGRVVELIMSFVMGFHYAGIRGGLANLKWIYRGRCAIRESDGMLLDAPVVVDGIRMAAFPWKDEQLWRESLQRIIEFEVGPDDVFVISYPKCGHHFLHEVLTMLLSGQLKLHKEQKMTRFLEVFLDPQKHFDKMESPRVILTHLPLKFLPKQVLEGKCKIIRCSRNPKDMLVSYYNHVLGLKFHFFEDSFANFFRLQTEEPCEAQYGCYFDFERDLWDALKPLVANGTVINITFEDMKLNPAQTFKKIADHLNLDRNQEFFERVAEETAFAKVKAAKSDELKHVMRPGASIWRKGMVGDWRNHFTPEMSARVDELMRLKWAGTPIIDSFNFGEETEEQITK